MVIQLGLKENWKQFILLVVINAFVGSMVGLERSILDRAISLGIFRLWRNLGYAIGALLTGIIADMAGIAASVLSIGLITVFSSAIIFFCLKCTH
jgi:hypothetical protein